MRFVYDTMDRDIANWLRENNPNPAGEKHHFQWLTEDFGYPKLIRHLMSIMGIQKASTTMENFKENLYRAYPEARIHRQRRINEKRRKKIKDIGQTELEFTYI